MDRPDMIRVRKKFSTQAETDIASEVASQFKKLDLGNRALRGASVAVGCSSRGIANYNSIVKATVDCLSQAGLEPFLFPAMGSHGKAGHDSRSEEVFDTGCDRHRERGRISVQEIGPEE